MENRDFFTKLKNESFLGVSGEAITLNFYNQKTEMNFDLNGDIKNTIKELFKKIMIEKKADYFFLNVHHVYLNTEKQYNFLLYNNGKNQYLSSNFLFCRKIHNGIYEFNPYIGYKSSSPPKQFQVNDFTIKSSSKGLLDDLLSLRDSKYFKYFAINVMRLLKFSSIPLMPDNPSILENEDNIKIVLKASIEVAMLILTSESLRSDKSSIISYIEFYKLKNENDLGQLKKMLLIMFFPLLPSLCFPKKSYNKNNCKYMISHTNFNELLNIREHGNILHLKKKHMI